MRDKGIDLEANRYQPEIPDGMFWRAVALMSSMGGAMLLVYLAVYWWRAQ